MSVNIISYLTGAGSKRGTEKDNSGVLQVKVARELNLPCVSLGTSEAAIEKAYREARLLLNVILNHERREKEIRTILDLSGEGFIAIDHQSKITIRPIWTGPPGT